MSIFTVDFFLRPEDIPPCLILLYDSPLYFVSSYWTFRLPQQTRNSEVYRVPSEECMHTIWGVKYRNTLLLVYSSFVFCFLCLPHQPCTCSNRVNKALCSDLFMCNGKASSHYILRIDATVAWCLYYWFEVRSGLVLAKIWGYNITEQEHVNSVY